MSRLADQLKRKLSSIGQSHGTAIFGAAEEEVLIEVNSAKMSSLGLTYQDISRAIQSLDSKKPVGVSSDVNSEFLIRLKDNIQSIQKISEIPIKVINEAEIIQLKDIAEISKKPVSPIEDIFLYNGQVVVSVAATGAMSQRAVSYTHLTLPTIYSV